MTAFLSADKYKINERSGSAFSAKPDPLFFNSDQKKSFLQTGIFLYTLRSKMSASAGFPTTVP